MAYVAPVQTVATVTPGFGTPTFGPIQNLNVAIAAGVTTTTTVPSSGTFLAPGSLAAFTLTRGYWRARFSNNGAAATLALTVTITDGTLIAQIFQSPVSTSTTNIYDFTYPFLTELLVNKFTFAATTVGGGGTFTADYEVAGSP